MSGDEGEVLDLQRQIAWQLRGWAAEAAAAALEANALTLEAEATAAKRTRDLYAADGDSPNRHKFDEHHGRAGALLDVVLQLRRDAAKRRHLAGLETEE